MTRPLLLIRSESTRKPSPFLGEMTREEGKTLPEAKGEVRRAINIFRYFAGEGARMPGMLVPSERDRVHMFAIRSRLRAGRSNARQPGALRGTQGRGLLARRRPR